MQNSREIFLSFDVEDFINEGATTYLYLILKLLKRYKIRGIFFVTGSIAEKIAKYPEILQLLKDHEIGYHSSSHSVKPRIFEFTDVESYSEAVKISLKRETSHIDPLTGRPQGKGGIILLRSLFPKKNISAFRAPYSCWSPPHLEALKELGFKFDFSANLSPFPVLHKGITFYCHAVGIDLINVKHQTFQATHKLRFLLSLLWKEKPLVLLVHPSLFCYKTGWDNAYAKEVDPTKLPKSKPRSATGIRIRLSMFLFWLSIFKVLNGVGIKITPPLRESKISLDLSKIDVRKIYEESMKGARKKYDCRPKFLFSHFCHFFQNQEKKRDSNELEP